MCNTENKTCTRGNAGNFGNVLLKNLLEEHKVLVVSSFSVELALLMAFVGSSGSTCEALQKVLRIEDINSVYEQISSVLSNLGTSKTITFTVANKVYIQKGFDINPGYTDTVKSQLYSEVEEINFPEKVKSAKTINNWVAKKTSNKIKELVQSGDLDETTKLLVLNAVYFKGNWAKKFKPSETTKEEFLLSNGDRKVVDMMHITGEYNFGYNEELGSNILEIPYEGDGFSMIVILPLEVDGIGGLKTGITGFDLNGLVFESTKILVGLPKFKIESEIPLDEVLSKMGLSVMFGVEANFCNISEKEGLSVSKVVQKAFIEVNEEGTEAAAATAMVMMTRSMPLTFIADHEFMFAIKYNDIILFTGVYS